LAERYSVVLEELRLEAVKQVEDQSVLQNGNPNLRGQSILNAPEAVMHESHTGVMRSDNRNGSQPPGEILSGSEATIFEGPTGTTPSSLMAELTGWGEFDSLVRTKLCFLNTR
jgi:hypothetical protein